MQKNVKRRIKMMHIYSQQKYILQNYLLGFCFSQKTCKKEKERKVDATKISFYSQNEDQKKTKKHIKTAAAARKE